MSVKNVNTKERAKYTLANMTAYVHYIVAVHSIPMERLKFLDESSFASQQLSRKRGHGPRGERVTVKAATSELTTYSVTVITQLTSLAVPVRVSNFKEGTNDGPDFLRFVMDCVLDGTLTPGDYLICDNARIHKSDAIMESLIDILTRFGVTLRFLPAYSPELNPCECVFAQAKHHLRYHRGNDRFWAEIVLAFATVTVNDVFAYYLHCIDQFFV
jgi:transposase